MLIDFSRHPEPRSSFRRRSSIIDFQPITGRRSSLAFRKNDQTTFDGTRRMSLLESKANGDLNKNMKNLVVKVCLLISVSLILVLSSTIISKNRLPLIYNRNPTQASTSIISIVAVRVSINYEQRQLVIARRKFRRRNLAIPFHTK